MLIFYTNLGPGGHGWYIGPLLMLLPFMLGSGLLSLPLNLLYLLFGGGMVGTTTTYVWDSANGWRQVESSRAGSAGWLSFLGTLVLTVLIFGVVMLAQQMRRHGVLPTLRRLLLTGWHGGQQRGQQQQQGGQPGGQRRVAGTQQERFERVSHQIQVLPTEVYHSREELEAMGAAELKGLLRRAGIKCQEGPLEKRELIDLLQSGANSTSTSCSICCEDYQPGDVLRALHCGHRFHLECIDRWLLSSTDYSRPAACPMCNAELAPGSIN